MFKRNNVQSCIYMPANLGLLGSVSVVFQGVHSQTLRYQQSQVEKQSQLS